MQSANETAHDAEPSDARKLAWKAGAGRCIQVMDRPKKVSRRRRLLLTCKLPRLPPPKRRSDYLKEAADFLEGAVADAFHITEYER